VTTARKTTGTTVTRETTSLPSTQAGREVTTNITSTTRKTATATTKRTGRTGTTARPKTRRTCTSPLLVTRARSPPSMGPAARTWRKEDTTVARKGQDTTPTLRTRRGNTRAPKRGQSPKRRSIGGNPPPLAAPTATKATRRATKAAATGQMATVAMEKWPRRPPAVAGQRVATTTRAPLPMTTSQGLARTPTPRARSTTQSSTSQSSTSTTQSTSPCTTKSKPGGPASKTVPRPPGVNRRSCWPVSAK